ncbi:Uncharacterised protein [Mycobacteroides abscessus]|nr:Uncharacterised protein [Mycobacteroides abscessus]
MSPRFHKVLVWTMAANVVIQLGSSAFGSKINFTTLSSATMFAAMAVFWWLYPPLLEARAQLLAGARPAPLPESGEGWAAMQNRP